MATENSATNKFCRSTDLSNEASVESFFVLRLLKDLGYEDREVKTKEAIEELRIPRGRKREPYKPDYLLFCDNRPRWIVDAKSTEERIDDWAYQCAGYSLMVNRKYSERPVKYYMLTNGLLTRVYAWDQEEPVLSLRFCDFSDASTKFQALRELLASKVARTGWRESRTPVLLHQIRGPREMGEVKKAFVQCHQIIWDSPESVGPQAAFLRFLKLLFVKL